MDGGGASGGTAAITRVIDMAVSTVNDCCVSVGADATASGVAAGRMISGNHTWLIASAVEPVYTKLAVSTTGAGGGCLVHGDKIKR